MDNNYSKGLIVDDIVLKDSGPIDGIDIDEDKTVVIHWTEGTNKFRIVFKCRELKYQRMTKGKIFDVFEEKMTKKGEKMAKNEEK